MALHSGRASPRAVTVLVHSFVFVSTAVSVIVVPLLPRLAERYSASGLAIGLVLTVPSLVMLLVSVPVGTIADSVGARRSAIVAAVLVTAGTVLQGFAPSLAAFLLARGIFAVGWAMSWVTGPSLLIEQARGSGGRASLGALEITAGAAFVFGPVLGAVLFSSFGDAAPFLVSGAAAGVVLVGLTRVPEFARRRGGEPRVSHVKWIRRAASGPVVITGVIALGCLGFSASIMNLAVPLGLHADGASSAQIGLAFSAAAVLYVPASAITVRFAARLVAIPAIAVMVCMLAITAVPAVVSLSALAIVVALMTHTAVKGGLNPAAYSLIVAASGGGSGAAVGLFNMSFAGASALGPVVGGLLLRTGSVRPAFAAIVVTAAAGSLVLARIGRRARVHAAAPAAEVTRGL